MLRAAMAIIVFSILLVPWPASGSTVHRDLDFFAHEIPESAEGGFEPHIIAGPGPGGYGEVFYIDSPNGVLSQLSGNLWRSDDGGDSWDRKPKDLGNLGASGDSYTAIRSDGTLYYTDLYALTVTIDVTTDGGDSWVQNPWGGSRLLDDRQWFAMGPTVNGLPGMSNETLYLSYNSADGLVVDRYRVDDYAFIKEAGTPVTTNTYARDYICVDQNDGTIYLPNYEGDSVNVYRSTDAGVTWDTLPVASSTGDVQNIFIACDVDTVGNIYLTWCDQRDIYMVVSTDRGESWTVHQVTNTAGTRVLPWITAGDAGMIGMNWYETADVGNSNDLDSNWSTFAAICVNATAPNPEFIITPVLEDMHVGSITTAGFGAQSDRDLGDFFTCDVDRFGRLILVTGRDDDDGVNTGMSRVVFLRQQEGPFLRMNVGPVAGFSAINHDLTVDFDGNDSQVYDDAEIIDWLWDFGDGSGGYGSDVRHKYRSEGTYNVTLVVTDSADRISLTSMTVTVTEQDENAANVLPLLAVVLIGAVLLVYLVMKGIIPVPLGKKKAEGHGEGVEASIDGVTVEEAPPEIPGGEAAEPPPAGGVTVVAEVPAEPPDSGTEPLADETPVGEPLEPPPNGGS